MTVIVACSWGGKTAIAGDRLGSNGWTGRSHGPKLRRYKWGVIGFSGSYRALSATHAGLLKIKRIKTEKESWKAVDLIVAALKAKGWTGSSEKDFPTVGSLTLLIATNEGKLWTLQSDLSIIPSFGVAGIGSGGDIAAGAAWTAKAYGADPRAAARAGVQAACDLVVSCAPPIDVRDLSEKAA